jgi:hypothetical protein
MNDLLYDPAFPAQLDTPTLKALAWILADYMQGLNATSTATMVWAMYHDVSNEVRGRQ